MFSFVTIQTLLLFSRIFYNGMNGMKRIYIFYDNPRQYQEIPRGVAVYFFITLITSVAI